MQFPDDVGRANRKARLLLSVERQSEVSVIDPFPKAVQTIRVNTHCSAVDAATVARIAQLRQELAAATQACESAKNLRQPGNLFFLLRKKWKLTQQLFEAESKLGPVAQ